MRAWNSSRSRNDLRRRQHLAEMDAQAARRRNYRTAKVDLERMAREQRIRDLLALGEAKANKPE